jgi:hypothetical protein
VRVAKVGVEMMVTISKPEKTKILETQRLEATVKEDFTTVIHGHN